MRRFALLAALPLAGCVHTHVDTADASHNRNAFSQAAYEEAMVKSGRAQELEQEKAQATRRREQERAAYGDSRF